MAARPSAGFCGLNWQLHPKSSELSKKQEFDIDLARNRLYSCAETYAAFAQRPFT